MNFAALESAWLLLAVPLLALFLSWSGRRRRRDESRFADRALYAQLSSRLSPARRRARVFLLAGAVLALVLAALQPRWGYHWEDVSKQGIDLVVAVDTSRSMLADDLKPSRLERTRLGIEDLLRMARGDRIGMVAFAGAAFALCPLTHDYGALRMFVNDLSPATVPRGGTNLGAGIDKALALFRDRDASDKAILIFTDGENLEGDWLSAAARAREKGVRIFAIGIGTAEGSPIRLKTSGGEGYLKDREGNIVVSRLDEEILKRVARETGGAYARGTQTGEELELIYRRWIAGLEKGETASRRKKVYEHRYQVPLLAAFLFLLIRVGLGEKRGPGFFPKRNRLEGEA